MRLLIKPPLRGHDKHGAGHFGAPRGDHAHKGIDMDCSKGSEVLSVSDGRVTKIGYPYPPIDPLKGHLRYVQVTDPKGYDLRYFYVSATVEVGDIVSELDSLGITQGLTDVYPGITDHYHFEVKKDGEYINPNEYLK